MGGGGVRREADPLAGTRVAFALELTLENHPPRSTHAMNGRPSLLISNLQKYGCDLLSSGILKEFPG